MERRLWSQQAGMEHCLLRLANAGAADSAAGVTAEGGVQGFGYLTVFLLGAFQLCRFSSGPSIIYLPCQFVVKRVLRNLEFFLFKVYVHFLQEM